MKLRTGRTFLSFAAIGLRGVVLLAFTSVSCVVVADEPYSAGLGAVGQHDHAPIVVRSRPVIERLPVQVIAPSDICDGNNGVLFIADRTARVVFRLTSDGSVSLAMRDEQGICRICCDSDNNLFVLSATAGSSRITQVTPTGKMIRICTLPFAAIAFARNEAGLLFVGSASGEIASVSVDGVVSKLAQLRREIVDLTLSSSDQLHVLTGNREICFVSLDGVVQPVGFGQPTALRLFALPHGGLAVLCPNPGGQPAITELQKNREDAIVEFARVPTGTVAVSFDRLGNLSLANPDLRAVTRVTSRFTVPCPHCGKAVDMVLSNSPPSSDADRRSF
jgi:hypothetical protein